MPETSASETYDEDDKPDCPRCGFPIEQGDAAFWIAEGSYWVHRGCAGL